MRVLVWGINYAPEQTGIGPYNTALCEFLAQRGHEVAMVSAFEYYPGWEKRPEDRGQLYRDEKRAGVTVHRCWLYVPEKVRALKRIAHELSFVVTSLARVLCLKRPDAFVVISPPLLLGVAAAIAGFLKRAPFLFHIQDLQPDAAIRLGMLRGSSSLARLLYAMESLAYSCAARISTISPGILRMIRSKQVPESKLVFFPNGVRLSEAFEVKGAFRARHGIPADTFIILYSGNLGVKQGLQVLVDAARILNQRSDLTRPILFVIAGTGAIRDKLVAQISQDHMSNVLLLPLQSEEAYREMMADADCCAITQQPGTGSLFFPSKLLTTLALSKPVLSIADEDSDLAHALKDGAFGVNVATGSPEAVATAVEDLSARSGELRQMGERGREYVGRYEMNAVLTNFEKELAELVGAKTAARSTVASAATSARTAKEASP